MGLNIYFHIDELSRDAIVASALKRELNSRGHKLTYGNRLRTEMLLEKFILSFDVVIIPQPLFLHNFKFLNKNKKIPPIVVLFTESAGRVVDLGEDKLTLVSMFDDKFMEGNSFYVDKVSAFLLWGNTTLNRVKKYFPSLVDKFTVVGHPRHDEMCTNAAIIEKSEKIRVGFITRQGILNDYRGVQTIEWVVGSVFHARPYEYYNKKTGDFLVYRGNNVIDQIYTESSDIDVMLKIINRLNPDEYELSLKVHPREDRSAWTALVEKYKINVKLVDWRTPFTHWAKSMDYVVGPASTTFYDCCMLGVKPISIQNISPACREHLEGFPDEFTAMSGQIDKPESIESLLELIKIKGEKFVLSEEIREILSLEVDFPGCKSSISKVADKCLALAETNNNSRIVKYINFTLFCFCSRIFNYFARVYRWWRKKPETSATYLLTGECEEFIDKLSGDRS
jgi:hypothetical protein